MRISFRYKFVFISKYKCASTSIRRALTPFSDVLSTQEAPTYHHSTLADAERYILSDRGESLDAYFVFTTVRHPTAMLSSLYAYGHPDKSGYYWWDRQWDRVRLGHVVPKSERAAECPVPFREWILEHDLSRFALDPFIRDLNGRVRANCILRVESLASEFPRVTERLGLGRVDLPHINIGSPQGHWFDQAMQDRVQEIFRSDLEFGRYRI